MKPSPQIIKELGINFRLSMRQEAQLMAKHPI